jgi:glycosyltransferase involved in cell wall biosynthesis
MPGRPDNGSEPPLALDGIADNVRLLTELKPGSYVARNRALQEATGEVLAFTDSNCVPDPCWLEAGVAALAGIGKPAFVGGEIAVSGKRPGKLGPIEAYEVVACFNQSLTISKAGCVATANLFVPREVMTLTGNFDTHFSGGDYLWSKRAVAAGAEPVYSKAALVTHPTRESRSAVLARERRLAGGHRDISPGARACLYYLMRHLKPPVRHIYDILRLPSSRISPSSRILAVLFAMEARLHMIAMRVWLEFSNGRSPR